MNNNGCYACKHCEIVRGKPFCNSGGRPTKLTEKQCMNKHGNCTDFEPLKGREEMRMAQTEWIISIDDDLKDSDELFVGNVRDGERLIRCKNCENPQFGIDVAFCEVVGRIIHPNDYCCWAERKEE